MSTTEELLALGKVPPRNLTPDELRAMGIPEFDPARHVPMRNRILVGDVREQLRLIPDETVHCVVTSPPYWGLRDYGVAGQLGLEATPDEYVANMVAVFRELRRVLRSDGTLWLNLGDSYANDGKWGGETGGKQAYLDDNNRKRVGREKRLTGLKPKDLVGIPWRVAFALQADGWYLRSDIIWSKPNPMPESVTDRPTKAHEYLFLLSKSERYYYDAEAIKELCSTESVMRDRNAEGYNPSLGTGKDRFSPGLRGYGTSRNRRTVWEIATEPYAEAHFATYPTELVKPCILAGCPEGGIVLDPFLGSGTTAAVAKLAGRDWLGIELNPEYVALAEKRIGVEQERLL